MNLAIDAHVVGWFNHDELHHSFIFNAHELDDVCRLGEYDFIICRALKYDLGLQLLQKLDSGKKNTNKKVKKAQYLTHQIDIGLFVKQNQQSFPASKKTLFSQAIGRKTQKVIDATGGWLGDTLLMCSQNYQVTVLERHWILQGFIAQACERLGETQWLQKNQAPLPELVKTDAIEYLQEGNVDADCIYIDPMFPPKVKKTAAVRKSMQVLHELVGQDTDAMELFSAALSTNVQRIVVKRPDYAEPLGANLSKNICVTETLQGKLVRYDVYLR